MVLYIIIYAVGIPNNSFNLSLLNGWVFGISWRTVSGWFVGIGVVAPNILVNNRKFQKISEKYLGKIKSLVLKVSPIFYFWSLFCISFLIWIISNWKFSNFLFVE